MNSTALAEILQNDEWTIETWNSHLGLKPMLRSLGPFELGPDGHGIYCLDAKDATRDIPDESVDLIFTDPVYQNIQDYEWLAQTAARILKPNKPLFCFCSNVKQYDVQPVMKKYLTFEMPFIYTVVAKSYSLHRYHTFVWTTPCLLFSKGHALPHHWLPDTFISTKPRSKDNSHKWNKNVEVYVKWIEAFTQPGDIVFDPFCGGGTTGIAAKELDRYFLGFEIMADVAEEACSRIRKYRTATQNRLPLTAS